MISVTAIRVTLAFLVSRSDSESTLMLTLRLGVGASFIKLAGHGCCRVWRTGQLWHGNGLSNSGTGRASRLGGAVTSRRLHCIHNLKAPGRDRCHVSWLNLNTALVSSFLSCTVTSRCLRVRLLLLGIWSRRTAPSPLRPAPTTGADCPPQAARNTDERKVPPTFDLRLTMPL